MLVLLMATMAMSVAAQTSPADRLRAGEEAMEGLEYESATYAFMAVAVGPDASEAERIQAHLRAGFAHRVLGKDTDARLNFRYVLQRAPTTRLPADTPPKVLFFFESVRQELEADRASATPSVPVSGPGAGSPTDAVDAPINGALIGGGVLAGVGAVSALAAGLVAVSFDQQLADPATDGAVRTGIIDAGRMSLIVAGVAAVVGVAGGAVMALGTSP